MRRHILLLISLLFSFTLLNAQETYRFRSDVPQGFSVESSTPTGLSLHYSINEIGIADIDNGEAKGQEIILNGCFGSFAEGLPNLPAQNRYIAVPRGATVSVEVRENGSRTFDGIDLLPAAEVVCNGTNRMPILRKDMSVFGTDAAFPKENVTIAQSTRIRGLDVVLLSVTPFRYNPIRKTLEVIYDMDIEVRFDGGNGQFGEARYRNPAWDGILRDLVINSDMLPKANYYDLVNQSADRYDIGCEYLIIAPDDDSILAWADTLRRFRNRQGVITKVVTTTDCGGNDANAIKRYIQYSYDHWIIPPAAIMIFGGMTDTLVSTWLYAEGRSGIPAFPLIFLNYNDTGENHNYFSDNPYADMNGDSIPDIAISRLPAITLKDYETEVSKIIQYETNPPTNPLYYDQPIISSGHEYNKWFLLTSQSVDGFFRNKLNKHPKNFYMQYRYAEQEPSDTLWSTGYNTDAVVEYFGPEGEQYVAQHLDTLSQWRNMFEYDYLIDALNQGSFLTLYRDHSAVDLWACPRVYASTIINHKQDTVPTYLISIGCHTGRFIYTYFNGELNTAPLIASLSNDAVGALGGIGAASVTHSHFNDILTWGCIDYIWPSFMSTMGSTTEPDFVRPVYALVAGKLFLNQHAFLPNWWPTRITTTHNVFHDIGEAYLTLYTEVPQELNITAPIQQSVGQQQYNFTAEEGALVCLSRSGELLQATIATGQPQSLTIPSMVAGEYFTLTATKQNRIRFQQNVAIVPNSGFYLIIERYDMQDENDDHTLTNGESAHINLSLYNAGTEASDSIEITLHCDSPHIEIIEGSAICPRVNPGEHIQLNNAFRIRAANDTPDQTTVAHSLVFNNGIGTQESIHQLTILTPALSIKPTFTLQTENHKPTTHILTEGITKIRFQIENIGHYGSGPVNARFEMLAPFTTTTNPCTIIENIKPDSLVSLDFPVETHANDITEAWLKMKLSINTGNQSLTLDTIIPYGGVIENFETDTLNPLFTWENDDDYPWNYNSDNAIEGQRSFMTSPPRAKISTLTIKLNDYRFPVDTKLSLYTNDTGLATLSVIEKTPTGDKTQTFQNPHNSGWTYIEPILYSDCQDISMEVRQFSFVYNDYLIDNLCLPPRHNPIAYAGDELISCKDASVEPRQAYAYDCNAVYWSSNGDGHFEDSCLVNPIYWPGDQDIANGEVTLSLYAINGSDTVVSPLNITILDEIQWSGSIIGDSIVNKQSTPFSHYSIENQDGINYVWILEPETAGCIFESGNEIDIVWNQHDDEEEVTLSLTADNGCEIEPITKRIRLIGTWITENQYIDFKLFPNPTDGKVNLVMDGSLRQKAVIEIYNLMGQCVMRQNAVNLGKGENISLDLSRMVPGLYIIKLSTGNGSCAKKVSVW